MDVPLANPCDHFSRIIRAGAASGSAREGDSRSSPAPGDRMSDPGRTVAKIGKTDEEWRKQLTDHQFKATRKHGTERAFSGVYWDHHDHGTYRCVCCG